MELSKIATTPKLECLTLDSEQIIEAYGEPIEFWIYDRQDIPTYLRLSEIKGNTAGLIEIVKTLIKDSKGKPALSADQELPVDVMVALIEKVVAYLGNGVSQILKK